MRYSKKFAMLPQGLSERSKNKMGIKKSKIGVISYIEPEIPITDEGIKEFKKVIEDCLKENEFKIVINFHSVSYIDSEGLDALLDILGEVRKRGGSIKISDPNPICNDIFIATRFNTIFEIYSSADRAGRSFL